MRNEITNLKAARAAFESIKALADIAKVIGAPVQLIVQETQVNYHTVAVVRAETVLHIHHLDETGDLRSFLDSCLLIKKEVISSLANKELGHLASSLLDLSAGVRPVVRTRISFIQRIKRLFPQQPAHQF